VRRKGSPRGLYAIIFGFFLVFFIAIQSSILISRDAGYGGYILSLVLSGILALSVFFFPMRHVDIAAPPRLMALLFFIFYPLYALIYINVPDLGKWYVQYFSSSEFEKNVSIAVFHHVLALPIFLVGFLIGDSPLGSKVAAQKNRHAPPTRTGLVLLTCASLIGFAGMLAYAQSIGGVGAVIEQMQSIFNRREWRETGSGLFYYLGMILLTGPMVIAVVALQSGTSRFRRMIAILFMLAGTVILLITQASREKSIFPLIIFMLTLLLLAKGQSPAARRLRPMRLAGPAAAALVLAFAVQTIFRWAKSGSSTLAFVDALSDFNRIDISIVMFVEYFKPFYGHDPLLGLPMLAYFNQFFVRLFDSAAIDNTSMVLYQFVFAGDVNAGYPGAPLVGELFLNFWYFGYLLFLPFGFYFGRIYSRLYRLDFELWCVLNYSVTLYFYMFKFCIYIGFSESVLIMILVYGQLWLWRRVSQFGEKRL
jgi:hypothetical protein